MFFFRKRFSERAGKAYWRWFQENEQSIIAAIADKSNETKEQSLDIIWIIDRHYAPLFPYLPNSEIEFQFGCNGDLNEMFLYYKDHDDLKRDIERLVSLMPQSLRDHWTVYIEE